MNAHDLARQLLAGPDEPVELHVGTPDDTFVADLGDCTIQIGKIDIDSARARGYPDTKPGNKVILHGWMSSECESDYDEESDEESDEDLSA